MPICGEMPYAPLLGDATRPSDNEVKCFLHTMCYASLSFLSCNLSAIALFIIFGCFFQPHLVEDSQNFMIKEQSFSCGAVVIKVTTSVHQS